MNFKFLCLSNLHFLSSICVWLYTQRRCRNDKGSCQSSDTAGLFHLIFRNGKWAFFMAISSIWYPLRSFLAVAKLKTLMGFSACFVQSDLNTTHLRFFIMVNNQHTALTTSSDTNNPTLGKTNKQTNKPHEYLLSYGWIYSKPTSHAWGGGLSDWRNLPIDMACAVSSGYQASHGSTWWKVHGTAAGSRRWLPLQWPRAELLRGPRNERAYSAKLLLWEKSREVFQTIACSTKTLNIPT